MKNQTKIIQCNTFVFKDQQMKFPQDSQPNQNNNNKFLPKERKKSLAYNTVSKSLQPFLKESH